MAAFSRFFENRPRLYSVLHILGSSILSLLVMCFLFPDLILRHQFSFTKFNDQNVDYYGVFTIVSNFFHGHIQLWDNYNQMPLAYDYLNGGMTAFSNLFTAAIYILISPLLHYPAEAFYSIYSVVYFYGSILVRSAGFYLLLSRFTKKKSILLFSTVFASSFMSPQSYLGLNDSNIFSFFPLIIHFMLRIFERRQFKYLVTTFLLMVICIGNYPFVSLSYFYLGVHIVLLSIIGWFLITNRYKLVSIFRQIKIYPGREKIKQAALVLLLSFLILLPFVYMLKENYKDYDFASQSSRFANLNIFNINTYFQRDTQVAPQKEFFYRMLNFEDIDWFSSWLYLGITAVFLVVCGIILNKDSRKYIFISSILLFFLINSPRDPGSMYSLSAIGHWIVALTDPFNFTIRTFHMTGAMMLPFVLVPLLTLGLDSLADIGLTSLKNKYLKLGLVEVTMMAIVASIYNQVSDSIRNYLFEGMAIITIVLIYAGMRSQRYKLRAFLISGILGILVILDGFGMKQYLESFKKNVDMFHHVREDAFIDYQNPLIMPFRQFYSLIEQNGARLMDLGIMIEGRYYHYTNLHNFFYMANNYLPRHISYANLSADTSLQEYLKKDKRLIYQADLAILQQKGMMNALVEKNLDKKIVLLDKEPLNMGGLYVKELPNAISDVGSKKEEQFKELFFDLTGSKPTLKNGLNFYSLKLPPGFPAYLATGILSDDITLFKFKLGDKEFTPEQGNLVQAYTFDIQNMETGKLAIALPTDYPASNMKGVLIYPQNYTEGIVDIWRYEPDNLGFDYKADQDGWLVMHYPYDKRWVMTVDGVKQDIFRANYSFITIPIQKGNHKILLQYWPDTWLREAIGLSIILLMISPVIIVWLEIKEISRNKN